MGTRLLVEMRRVKPSLPLEGKAHRRIHGSLFFLRRGVVFPKSAGRHAPQHFLSLWYRMKLMYEKKSGDQDRHLQAKGEQHA